MVVEKGNPLCRNRLGRYGPTKAYRTNSPPRMGKAQPEVLRAASTTTRSKTRPTTTSAVVGSTPARLVRSENNSSWYTTTATLAAPKARSHRVGVLEGRSLRAGRSRKTSREANMRWKAYIFWGSVE